MGQLENFINENKIILEPNFFIFNKDIIIEGVNI